MCSSAVPSSFRLKPVVFAGLTDEMLYLIQRYTRQNTYSGCVRKMLGRKAEWFTDLIQVGLPRYSEV